MYHCVYCDLTCGIVLPRAMSYILVFLLCVYVLVDDGGSCLGCNGRGRVRDAHVVNFARPGFVSRTYLSGL
jgi:hypothetical protein